MSTFRVIYQDDESIDVAAHSIAQACDAAARVDDGIMHGDVIAAVMLHSDGVAYIPYFGS